jgi:alpha-galactosidase
MTCTQRVCIPLPALRSSQCARLVKFLIGVLLVAGIAGGTASVRCQTIAADLTSPDLWKPEHVPFSFNYGGKESAKLLPVWQFAHEDSVNGDSQLHRYFYTDPVTHLKITAEIRLFPDFPGVVDWVLRFCNDGPSDTPILEDLLPLDWSIPASPGKCFVRHAKGSANSAEDFTPLEEFFGPDDDTHLESRLGRSSSGDTLPFFNLQTGDHGLIGAIGWSGNWKADVIYPKDGKTVVMKSGMKKTHLLLHPGEEIRTPRIVLMSWTGGNWQNSQNRWRRMLFAHYSPKQNGKSMKGPVLFGSWGSEPIADKLAYIQWVHDHKIPVDVYAVDAGWYGNSVGAETDPTNPWWKNRGDWYPSPLYYPNGIKPLGDALRADGIGFSLWVEPETAMPGMKIFKDHPDWFLHRDSLQGHDERLANLGDPTVRKGLTDMVSNFITEFGMTWHRQDFNIDPEPYWQVADTPDRIGMTEIGHIEGLYKMWDDLLALHPGLRIDNCASGGRRLDIEMMSRSFVFWRTDHGFSDTLAEQAQTQTLALWVPENMGFETYTMGLENTQTPPWKTYGPYTTPEHLYLMRLGYSAGYGINPGASGVDNDAWAAWIKRAIAEYREVQPYIYGDFYALLPYSRGEESWTAWQWDRPEDRDGLVMIFRRPQSPFTEMELNLKQLGADAIYEVEIRATQNKTSIKMMKGSELAHRSVRLPDAPSSTLIFYRRRQDCKKPRCR